jgi:hypothetical protein
MAIPVLDHGLVRTVQGPRFQVRRDSSERAATTERALAYLEEQIRLRPAIKNDILLEPALGLGPSGRD